MRRPLTIWLVKPFDGLGAFAVGPGCEITEEGGGLFFVRLGARTLGVPLTNVAGIEYSTVEEVASAGPALPMGPGGVTPSPVETPAPKTVPQGRRR